MPQRVAMHLMFTGQAAAALALYGEIFPSFHVERVERYAANEPGPEGSIKRADATFCGLSIVAIDSPVTHAFTFTPSTSIFVDCESETELDAAFRKLSEQGQVYMPIGDYGFSRRFGWCGDRFGVSWQLNLP
jgi:predicted 3-demethylubiquinone-9 3-methyltransferase (glyoxalase superfamily)